MKIGIVYKKEKIKNKHIVSALIQKFQNFGCAVKIIHSGAELNGVDTAVVLGGDGALIYAAVIAAQQGIRVVGVNHGTLGFLCEFDAKDTLNVVDLICGEHTILPRSVLKITLDGREYYALNEVILQRDYARPYGNQVAEFSLMMNGAKVQDYIADGLTIATPTGSTAYSLSAGGCILAPDVQAFIATPVCPLGLRSKPFIVSDAGKFSFDLSRQDKDLKLCADGRVLGNVNKNSRVCIEKAPFTADFITRDINRLFYNVNKKLLK